LNFFDDKGPRIEGFDNELRPIVSYFGFDYKYESETDFEEKYITPSNKKFKKWKRIQREAHVLRLWRTLFNKALSCSIAIT